MKKVLTQESVEVIAKVLETVDVYFCNDTPWTFLTQDTGIEKNPDLNFNLLRFNWIFSHHGLVNTIPDNSLRFDAILDFLRHGDNLNTLRQRVHILHDILDYNFDSDVPVHISLGLAPGQDSGTLDFNNPDPNVTAIIHPGQTRAQGTVFLQGSFKNTLFYIKKEISDKIKIDSNVPFRKIRSVEELLECYKVKGVSDEDQTAVLNFFMKGDAPDIGPDGAKIHRAHHNTPILKCENMYIKGSMAHPSEHYAGNSLKTYLEYLNFYKYGPIKVYTLDLNRTEKAQRTNINRLLSIGLNTEESKTGRFLKSHHSRTPGNFSGYHTLQSDKKVSRVLGVLSPEESTVLSLFRKFMSAYHTQLRAKEAPEELIQYPFYTIQDIDERVSLNFLVKKHEYRGGFIYIHSSADTKRSIEDYLFLLNPNYSAIQTHSKSVTVVNCAHEGWKDESKFTIKILPESFI